MKEATTTDKGSLVGTKSCVTVFKAVTQALNPFNCNGFRRGSIAWT
ncbi:hypothetical protein EV07_1004 [Prochlorococcus sp. MIT 0603]|nr:hypothetical protein EV07_1004 [Prochlorococcus sp. MIT 0603]